MPKRAKASSEELLTTLLSIHVPIEYLSFFELEGVNNKPDIWELVLEEKSDLIPKELSGKEAVLDGFCNSVSVLTQSFSLKKIYLLIKRRRWKEPNSNTHYSNSYELHEKGIKMTKDFAAFLKAID
jgi:hypothetical protein